MPRRKKTTKSVFSKNLISLMEEKKITVRVAAKMAGVPVSTLDSWRQGADPSDFKAVKKLSKELGVSMSFLLTSEEEEVSKMASIIEVFEEGDQLFDGFAKISIQRLIPRKKANENSN